MNARGKTFCIIRVSPGIGHAPKVKFVGPGIKLYRAVRSEKALHLSRHIPGALIAHRAQGKVR